MVDQKFIEKIRKLLVLSDTKRNPNPHEAMAAAEMAAKMLAEHNLNRADVENNTEGLCYRFLDVEKAEIWVEMTAHAAGLLYYCKLMNLNDKLAYLGTPENTLVASEIFFWLRLAITNEAAKKFAQDLMFVQIGLANQKYFDVRINSFCVGAAKVINLRAMDIIEAEKRKAEGESTGKNQLMVLLRNKFEKANDEFMEQQNIQKMPEAEQEMIDPFAMHAGAMFGGQVGLERQLNGSTEKRIERNG